ncbi:MULTISPECIES: Cof-type HAD-IIB family hydrolase [unclassified Companilactobacillus]|jgi:Cof subfamily protein (haloacid dehalogenase superfamily)|uniref:Cof-type HAD-IIB family hydrolase n=1 Tax=unclassified Companilactobacillus TaxID=2767904 RepID=UPI002FF06E77
MDIKMIAIDMDGTLLDDKKKISADNKAAIKKALDQGIKVVLNSGRSYDGIIDSCHELGISGSDQYIIEFGGNVIESLDKKIHYRKVLENTTCQEIAEQLTDDKIAHILIDTKGNIYDSYQEWMEKRMLDPELGIVKFLMHTRKHKLNSLAASLHQKFDQKFFIVITSPRDIELFPKEVNKGLALQKLAKRLKINMKQVLAIGDLDNDVPMLKLAGVGVAMANSPQRIKNFADDITLDNNHSGVGVAITKYALSEDK